MSDPQLIQSIETDATTAEPSGSAVVARSGNVGNRERWIARDRPLPRVIRGPVRAFLHLETASGFVLLLATLAALAVANTAAADEVERFFSTELVLFEFGDVHLEETVLHWVNDGLMVMFFFVVGLEIKREIAVGELADPTQALLPVIAAIGGMVVPAGAYLAIVGDGPGVDGWGIPMATDIAFALGVVALLGPRVSPSMRLFLLTLAIVDDVAAIVVIAVFYTTALNLAALGAAAALLFVIAVLRSLRVWYLPIYVVLGIGVWLATLASGVHATIAGVALGLLAPARPLRPEPHDVRVDSTATLRTIRSTIFETRETIPVADRLQHTVHPWTAFLILPLFAFANARIDVSPSEIASTLTSPVGLGVALGLVIGKPAGIVTATWLAQRAGVASLPRDCSLVQIAGIGAVAGIGFTVSLFVAELAFTGTLLAEAKLAVLFASLIAAGLGAAVLWLASRKEPHPSAVAGESAGAAAPGSPSVMFG